MVGDYLALDGRSIFVKFHEARFNERQFVARSNDDVVSSRSVTRTRDASSTSRGESHHAVDKRIRPARLSRAIIRSARRRASPGGREHGRARGAGAAENPSDCRFTLHATVCSPSSREKYSLTMIPRKRKDHATEDRINRGRCRTSAGDIPSFGP